MIDTFGQSSAVSNAGAASPSDKTVSVLQNFSKYAAAGGALKALLRLPSGLASLSLTEG